ncbi:MAG TPA: AIR synthase-related protein, partial [Solirubrobacterales bacterium]|nr:AIR synthase-related protein [Solirubrobacterales bacterium]
PTPVVGMVGELPDPAHAAGENWREGDSIALVGPFDPSLAGSELEKQRGQLGKGLPQIEIAPVREAIELVREAVRSGRVRTATDVSDGGITTALAELAIGSGLGCDVHLTAVLAKRDCSAEDALFGEGPGGFILAGDEAELEKLGGHGVEFEVIGEVRGNELIVTAADRRVEILVEEAEAAFESLEDRIESDQAGLTH